MDASDVPPAFDTLAIVQKLEAAGVERKQAEAHAEALRDSQARLATKADIARLEAKMDGTAGAVATRTDVAELRDDICRAMRLQTGVIVGAIVAASGLVATLA